MTLSKELQRRDATPKPPPGAASPAAAARAVPHLPAVPNRTLGAGRANVPRPLEPRIPAPQRGPQVPAAPALPHAVAAQPRPGVRPAGAFRDVPPEAFADTWELRPTTPMRIGVRLLADGDYDKARAAAARLAADNHPTDPESRIEAFNEALMQWVVARGTCKADDVSQPFWQCPQDIVPIALSPDGLRLLFDAIEELKIEKTPLGREADDAALQSLGTLLQIEGVRTVLVRDGSKRLRRLLQHVLDEVNRVAGTAAPHVQESPDDIESEGSVLLPRGPVG